MPAQLQKQKHEATSTVGAPNSLFGPPPLIDGEVEADYVAFAAQVREAVAPADKLEEIWVRDVVDHVWEVQRLRRLKGKYLQAATYEALKQTLESKKSYFEAKEFVQGWARRDPAMIEAVNDTLSDFGFDLEHVTAQALAKKVDVFEKIDRLIAAAESRRDQALRELERRRESLARRLVSATQIIEDAEFQEVEPALDAPR